MLSGIKRSGEIAEAQGMENNAPCGYPGRALAGDVSISGPQKGPGELGLLETAGTTGRYEDHRLLPCWTRVMAHRKRLSNLDAYRLLVELPESFYFLLFFIVALVILRTDVQMNGDSRNLRLCQRKFCFFVNEQRYVSRYVVS
jgi:hypothetical protein